MVSRFVGTKLEVDNAIFADLVNLLQTSRLQMFTHLITAQQRTQHRLNSLKNTVNDMFEFVKLTVKSAFFTSSLFHEFCDFGDVAKITGHTYSKSDATYSVLLS